ncbi:MAG: hypothetical protein NTY19_41215 [Planctomycetota bacterium]|nr:hypothetical protein [Planctomycetota bacterium]
MSEYAFVEKPFLDQLTALDWQVIDQGQGVPTNPAKSLRTSFRELVLKDVFYGSVRAINTTSDGKPWLTGTNQRGQDSLFANSSNNRICGRPRGRSVDAKPSRWAVDSTAEIVDSLHVTP